MKKFTLWFSILGIMFLLSCVTKVKIQKPVVKYVKEQKCSPNKWYGIPIDTSSEYKKVAESYYIFEPVRDINSPANEWALSFIDEKNAILTYNDVDQQSPIAVTFVSETKAKTTSGLSIPLEGHIGCFSLQGNNVFFARSPILSQENEITGNSDIYMAKFNKNVVANVKSLSEWINPYYVSWESHPSISNDGKVLFFSSDRIPYKGPDIFFTIQLPNGDWSEPINCGDSINTECDEISPFVTRDGKYLLFSSTGHDNVGGYDLFISTISEQFWKEIQNYSKGKKVDFEKYFGKAKNMRPPTNTIADEIFPSTPTDPNDLLYYSSNQFDQEKGLFRRGGFDIYVRYKFTKPKKVAEVKKQEKVGLEVKEDIIVEPKITIDPNFKLYGYVYSYEGNRPIDGANVYVYQFDTLLQAFPDVTITKPMFSTKTKNNGYYEFSLLKNIDYQLFAEAPNFFYETKRIRLDVTEPQKEYQLDFHLPMKLTLRINFPFDVYDNPYKYTLDSNGMETNITWEEAIEMLALHLINYSPIIKKVILVGHTDDVGTDEYNLRLGKNRVDFIIKQLIKRGVSPDILEGQSAGESQLLPRNPNEDLATYRKRLRRVEISKIY
ncbi:MAG: OmpA family protein [Ignavibacteria bacterium]|nr:OmpA family protein [Ignavibacteria bacterium]